MLRRVTIVTLSLTFQQQSLATHGGNNPPSPKASAVALRAMADKLADKSARQARINTDFLQEDRKETKTQKMGWRPEEMGIGSEVGKIRLARPADGNGRDAAMDCRRVKPGKLEIFGQPIKGN